VFLSTLPCPSPDGRAAGGARRARRWLALLRQGRDIDPFDAAAPEPEPVARLADGSRDGAAPGAVPIARAAARAARSPRRAACRATARPSRPGRRRPPACRGHDRPRQAGV